MQLLSALLLAAAAVPQPAPEWRYDTTVDGMRVEHREVPGSAFDEVRVSLFSSASLERLCEAIFEKSEKHRTSKPEGRFKRRDVLRETDTERWTYEQISVPVVSDRDYVMHVTLLQPPSTGRCEVAFETTSDAAHPPVNGLVRIPCIRGSWALAQDGTAVRISYQVFCDPGGGVPAFLARGGQRDAAVDFLKTIVARARASP